MPPDIAEQQSRLVRSNSVLPPTVETVLRRLSLDKFTGNVQLNIKDGKILGWHEHKIGAVPSNEIS